MRTFLPLVLGLLVSGPLFAFPPEEDILRPRIERPGKVEIQIDVGTNFTWLEGNPSFRAFFPNEEESDFFDRASGFGALAALSVGYRPKENLIVRIRAGFDSRVADNGGTAIDTCPLFDPETGLVVGGTPVLVEKEYSVEIDYLTLALLGEVRFSNVFVFAGPSYSIGLRRRVAETDRLPDGESSCTFFSKTPDTARTVSAELGGRENIARRLAVTGGAGYTMPLTSHWALVSQIGLDLQLGDLFDDFESLEFRGRSNQTTPPNRVDLNHQMQMLTVQLSIGVRYAF